jgi:hypothetical protein
MNGKGWRHQIDGRALGKPLAQAIDHPFIAAVPN